MKFSVIGIGKLGLCFALYLESLGHEVVGIDISQEYVDKLNSKTLKSSEPSLEEYLTNAKNFSATTELSAIEGSDLVFILVQTPVSDESDNFYDHGILEKVIKDVNNLGKYDIVVNSTVIPGFYNKWAERLKGTLSYNPAFVSQGNVFKDYTTGGKFGVTILGTEHIDVYEKVKDLYPTKVHRMSPPSAEIFKICNNTFRVMKIAYTNYVRDLATRVRGACPIEISEAMKADSSIGPVCTTPGYGYGGPCYPRDTKAVMQFAKNVNMESFLPDAIDMDNQRHHKHLLEEIIMSGRGTHTFENVTYRPDMSVPMIDNSPKLKLAEDLVKMGHNVVIKDTPETIECVKSVFGDMFSYVKNGNISQ